MAGAIDSRKGRATAAPIPRRNVRRGNDLLAMIIFESPLNSLFPYPTAFGGRRASETEHFARFPVPPSQSYSSWLWRRERWHGLPAYHNAEAPARAHKSLIFLSKSGQKHLDVPSAP